MSKLEEYLKLQQGKCNREGVKTLLAHFERFTKETNIVISDNLPG